MYPDMYQAHLDRVSRSFAFCIQQLRAPLDRYVALSYLLCRVLDTIEDATWPDPESQRAHYSAFDHALETLEGVEVLKTWPAGFPADVTKGEAALLKDAARLIGDYHELPRAAHALLHELIQTMSSGMQHFSRARAGGELRLGNVAEVNQYCLFVAGVVGELLAKLVARDEPQFELTPACVVGAHHFGQFLQKVNLLKDQAGDEALGRHLIPSRELVESSARENAIYAFKFLLAIPERQIEFRRFCAWSLFIGLESLTVFSGGEVRKINRARTQEIILELEGALGDNGALSRLFSAALAKLRWSGTPPMDSDVGEPPTWLTSIYRGSLKPAELGALRLEAPPRN